MGKCIDFTGIKFNYLTMIERIGTNKYQQALWLCKCDCGETTIAIGSEVKSGKKKSCGCYKTSRLIKRVTTHGLYDTRLHHTWGNMKDRCYNKNSGEYYAYGGRGIAVCEEWRHNFQAFYDWAVSHGYSDNLTIERVNVDGNYEPQNCKWATRKEQMNNTRRNRKLTYNGKVQTLQQWADETGIRVQTLWIRLDHGWDVEKALTTPVKQYKKRGA